MTNEQYQKNLARLKEIEALVRDPQTSLDRVDELIVETRELSEACYAYVREIQGKVDALSEQSSYS